MPIHEPIHWELACDRCGNVMFFKSVPRTHVPSGWTVTKGKTLADVTVLCPMCSEIERMEDAHD